MKFEKLFSKSNSSLYQLQGNVLQSTIEQKSGHPIIIDTGMRPPFVCSRNEVFNQSCLFTNNDHSQSSVQAGSFVALPRKVPFHNAPSHPSELLFKKNLKGSQREVFFNELNYCMPKYVQNTNVSKISTQHSLGLDVVKKQDASQRAFVVGIEEKRSSFTGDLICISPQQIEKISLRKLVWTELTKLWIPGAKSPIKGFILNFVNGGYAVALAGYIAFLPRSLCIDKKIFRGQWRQFAIISMNQKITNIVVKEVKTSSKSTRKTKLRSFVSLGGPSITRGA